MKKIITSLAIVLSSIILLSCFVSCNILGDSTDGSTAITEFTFQNPITKLTLNNKDTTLVVGETLKLDYTVTPTDTDEEIIFSVGDTAIAEIVDNMIVAKSVGRTYISLADCKMKLQ
jgi:hypothetical protein